MRLSTVLAFTCMLLYSYEYFYDRYLEEITYTKYISNVYEEFEPEIKSQNRPHSQTDNIPLLSKLLRMLARLAFFSTPIIILIYMLNTVIIVKKHRFKLKLLIIELVLIFPYFILFK